MKLGGESCSSLTAASASDSDSSASTCAGYILLRAPPLNRAKSRPKSEGDSMEGESGGEKVSFLRSLLSNRVRYDGDDDDDDDVQYVDCS